MSKYIDKEMVISIIEAKQKELCPVGRYSRHYVYGSDREKYDNWGEIIDDLENIPVVDVESVVYGRWINEGPYKSIGGDWMKAQQCSA